MIHVGREMQRLSGSRGLHPLRGGDPDGGAGAGRGQSGPRGHAAALGQGGALEFIFQL